MTTIERFMKYVRLEPSGCATWVGCNSGHGYGKFWMWGAQQQAHRSAFLLWRGPVQEGMDLDHLCRNTRCVNPWHLEPVSHGENVRRGLSPLVAGARQSAKTHCPKGHPYSGDNLYLHPGGSRHCRVCKRAGLISSRERAKERQVRA